MRGDILRNIAKKIIYKHYKTRLKYLGEGTKINPTASLDFKNLISIGHHSFIGKWCHISIVEPATLKIGNYVGISPYVKILGGDRNLTTVGKYFMTVDDGQNKPITIEDDVMVGMEAMILKGVTIGQGSIIGARAVVATDILPYTVAVGSPAKMIKLRFNPDDLKKHMHILYGRDNIDDLLDQYRKHNLI